MQAGNPGAEPGRSTIWLCRLPARTPASHAGRAGSTPARATIQRCGEAANAAVSYAADRRCKSFQRYQLPARCCKRHTPLVPEERRGRSGSRPPWAGRLTGRHGRRNAVIRVRFPAGPPMASSSNGKDTCPSNRERGFNSRRGYHCCSSSNGQSAALRAWRLGIIPLGRHQHTGIV